jgi:signal transduction histidine kinase
LINIRAGLPGVYADKSRIVQVLGNLVENAARFSPVGSPITIEAQVNGDWMILSVADGGAGIEPEALDKIFNRFYGVDRRESDKLETIGLGLPLSKGIIEAHGGKIRAELLPNRGTKISFSIPVVRTA